MSGNDTKNKIEDIISGAHITWQADHCTAVRNFLCRSFSASTTVKKDFDSNLLVKEKQVEVLWEFIDEHQLWVERPPDENKLVKLLDAFQDRQKAVLVKEQNAVTCYCVEVIF